MKQNARIVFSIERRRPGCVLLQAALGGTLFTDRFQSLFPTETWLVAPTSDMRAYTVTDAELERLSEIAANAVKGIRR